MDARAATGDPLGNTGRQHGRVVVRRRRVAGRPLGRSARIVTCRRGEHRGPGPGPRPARGTRGGPPRLIPGALLKPALGQSITAGTGRCSRQADLSRVAAPHARTSDSRSSTRVLRGRRASGGDLPQLADFHERARKSETFADAVRLEQMEGLPRGFAKTGDSGKTWGPLPGERSGPPSRPRSTPDAPSRADLPR
jgi:hypothetical protein